MAESKWLEVCVNTTAAQLEQVSTTLIAAGMESFSVEEEGEFLQFLEENRQQWDYVEQDLLESMRGIARIKFYVTDDAAGRAALAQYTANLGAEYTLAPLTDNDWAYSWQKYYHPLSVGEKLEIVPEWERDTPLRAGRTAVYLNPGLSFGTGSHASTQLCLQGLEGVDIVGKAVLDLGCGSGILSICALRLGASTAVAVDIDPKAVDVAYENAALNGIDNTQYRALAGNVLQDAALVAQISAQRYALVLANIVADVIIPLSTMVPALLDAGGTFICSGIIDTRASEVAHALKKNGLRITRKDEKDGWVALHAQMQ